MRYRLVLTVSVAVDKDLWLKIPCKLVLHSCMIAWMIVTEAFV